MFLEDVDLIPFFHTSFEPGNRSRVTFEQFFIGVPRLFTTQLFQQLYFSLHSIQNIFIRRGYFFHDELRFNPSHSPDLYEGSLQMELKEVRACQLTCG